MKRKHFYIAIPTALIIAVVVLGLIYPFSAFSFDKSAAYDADNVFVKGYAANISKLKQMVDKNPQTTLSDEMADFMSKSIFTNEKKQNISRDDLEILIFDVTNAQTGIKKLAFSDDQLKLEALNNLGGMLKTFEYYHEQLLEMKESTFETRGAFQKAFHRFHMSLSTGLQMLITFEEIHSKE